MSATVEELDSGRMSLMEHLGELRNRVIKSVLAVFVGAIVCWFLYPQIYDALVEPYCEVAERNCALNIFDPLEGFNTRMTIAGYGGVALAVPVWLWQAWRFISPGLYAHEKRHGVMFVGLGVLLFALGASLAYWSLPRALDFLIDVGGEDINTTFRVGSYVTFVTKMMIAFGLGFQFPLLLVFLQIIGVINHQMLTHHRRLAGVFIVVLVAVITPSGDPYTLVVLSVPMYLFYEGAILFGFLRERRRRKRELASA